MSGSEQALVAALFESERPRPVTAWTLWAFFAPLGVHALYLGRWDVRWAAAMTGFLLFAAFGGLFMLVPLVWVSQVAALPNAIDARTREVVTECEQVVRAARRNARN